MTRDEAIAYFRAIEALHGRTSTDWRVDGNIIVARLIPQKEPEPVATLDPFADRNDITHLVGAHERESFLIGLVKDLGAEVKALRPKPKREITFANRAGMLIGDAEFQEWIFETDGFEKVRDPKALKTHVRLKLRINSLNDLDTKEEKRPAWFDLCRDFDAWKTKRKGK